MIRIIGLSGSLRRASFNTALLRAAAAAVPSGMHVEVETLHGIPLYDGDLEAQGIPERVADLKDRIAAADGLILSTPEYNFSIPGVFKNAIDWLSRPPADIPRVFGGKPVALMGASPGAFGTTLSQMAWLNVLRALNSKPWFGPRLLVSHAKSVFDPEGRILDSQLEARLRTFMSDYADFVGAGD
jgi:NAD(P)H-dependent FMN reductase